MRNHDEFMQEIQQRKRKHDTDRNRKARIVTWTCLALAVVLILPWALGAPIVPDVTAPTYPPAQIPQGEELLTLEPGVKLDLLGNFVPAAGEAVALDRDFSRAQMTFALNLLRGSYAGESLLVSPLSANLALSMTANGARSNTLAQMEDVLCGGMDIGTWNRYLNSYVNQLPSTGDTSFSLGNAIWYDSTRGLQVNRNFLQTVADSYDAGIYAQPFDDKALSDINGWIEHQTHGMIKNALTELEGVMLLVNALAFEGKWAEPYNEHQLRDGKFFPESGDAQDITMMHSTETLYLEDENATGFMKSYEGGAYRFVAILPREGLTLGQYLDSLTPESLQALLAGASRDTVIAQIPSFTCDSDLMLRDLMIGLGMEDAFDGQKADLKAMATSPEGNLFITKVIHKTHITVDAQGTKAAAATVVITATGAAPLTDNLPKYVILDRPFLYMIVDTQTNLPIFMGTLDRV